MLCAESCSYEFHLRGADVRFCTTRIRSPIKLSNPHCPYSSNRDVDIRNIPRVSIRDSRSERSSNAGKCSCCYTQMGSPWERIMTLDVAGEVLEQLKWDRGASGVFRQTCRGWRDGHDRSVIRLSVTRGSLPWRTICMMRNRFPGVTEIEVRGKSSAISSCGDKWVRTFAGLTCPHQARLIKL
jgi:hypothetical protein